MKDLILKDPIFKDLILKDPILKNLILKDPILKYLILKDPILKDSILKDPILKDPILKDPILKDHFSRTSEKKITINFCIIFKKRQKVSKETARKATVEGTTILIQAWTGS